MKNKPRPTQMRNILPEMFLLFLLSAALTGCRSTPHACDYDTISQKNLPPPNAQLNIPQLGPCLNIDGRTFSINTNHPVIILVHGCYGSVGRFRALAQVFAFHGQQAVCFSYNDRENLLTSAAQLQNAIAQLATQMHSREITVIGHSLGGLVARKALTTPIASNLPADLNIQLITVSSPFSGISAASHCASKTAMVLTLGMAYPLCRLISGEKWHQITPASNFIIHPGTLLPQVHEHIVVLTDERNTCRTTTENGNCKQSDFVFSLSEQDNPTVTSAPQAYPLEIQAGHVEIIGNSHQIPNKLINLLQSIGVMNETTNNLKQLNALLTKIY